MSKAKIPEGLDLIFEMFRAIGDKLEEFKVIETRVETLVSQTQCNLDRVESGLGFLGEGIKGVKDLSELLVALRIRIEELEKYLDE